MNSVREVGCIVEAGVRYCEKEDINLREFGIVLVAFFVWISTIVFCILKSMDTYDSLTAKLWLLAGLLVLLSPMIAMIIFG